MKSLKKKLAVSLTLVFLTSLLFNTVAFGVSASNFENTISVVDAAEKAAIAAYHDICENFETDNNGYIVFPDDFGEAYYKNGKLHVNVKDLTPVKQALYETYCSNPAILVFHDVSYGYNELSELASEIAELDRNDITGIGVNAFENIVEVGLDISSLPKASPAADVDAVLSDITAELDLPAAFSTRTRDSLPITVNVETAPTTAASLIGGSGAYYESSHLKGSYAISGTWNGATAILTAGHVANDGEDVYLENGAHLGDVAYYQYTHNQYYDWGVYLTPGHTRTNMVRTGSGTTAITCGIDYVGELLGTTVTLYGEVTEGVTGTITIKGHIANYRPEGSSVTTRIHGLTKVTPASGSQTILDGDSGGAVFNGKTMYGIISGYWRPDEDETGTPYSLYSPIYGVSSAFVPYYGQL